MRKNEWGTYFELTNFNIEREKFCQWVQTSAREFMPPGFRGQFHQRSITSFLRTQIPKVQKDTNKLTELLCFWVPRAQKLLVEC